MLKRKIMESLIKWKENSSKCLLIDGARQVGKTFIVREFAKVHFESVFELNFIENPDLKTIFTGSLQAETLLMLIRTFFPQTEFIAGQTLIFLDEIQECPEAISALKFLAADQRIKVIATGSALGLAYQRPTSYPVGSVDYLDMSALDFEEFLWSQQIDQDILAEVKKSFVNRSKVHPALHQQMLQYLTKYMVIGGMPEVVQTFVDTGDYLAADKVQRRLHRDYLADIARFATPDIKIKAEATYKSIPKQLTKDNHKFQYGIVERKATARKFESSVDWLLHSHFVLTVNNVSTIKYPLSHYRKDNNFRLYPTDIGLLMVMFDVNIKASLLTESKIDGFSDNLNLQTAKGGLFEGLAADMLYKKGIKELYFYRNDIGTVEIEYLIEGREGVIPIEVKAGRNPTRSLDKILEDEQIPFGYKFSTQNVGVSGKKITLPLYMLMFL